MVTDDANRVRNSPSSNALSPPPTTTSFFPLKNHPSQVAQYETPRLSNSFSPGMFKWFGLAPVEMISDSALYSALYVLTVNGRFDKSTSVAMSNSNRAPKCSACFLKSSPSSAPPTPSGKPG